jgi:MFS transporter, DHA1 family, multidrug resistance protein
MISINMRVLKADHVLVNRDAMAIVSHYFWCNFSFFGVLASLVVILSARGFLASEVGVMSMVYTLTFRGGKLLCAPLLDNAGDRIGTLVGSSLAAVGLVMLSMAGSTLVTFVALLVAGLGIAINNIASKMLAAAASDLLDRRSSLFSLINVVVNLAASIAPLLALHAVQHALQQQALCIAGVLYLLSGIITVAKIPGASHVIRERSRSFFSAYMVLLRRSDFLHFMWINGMGWCMYGQLFNTFALHMSQTLHEAPRLGWLYTLNAILIVVCQMTVTSFVDRAAKDQNVVRFVMAYFGFSLAFAVPALIPGIQGMIAAVGLFTLAEMVFVPAVDVALLGVVGQSQRAVAYSLLAVSTAVGEAIGGGAGLALYQFSSTALGPSSYWLMLATIAVAFALVTALSWKITLAHVESPEFT